MSMDERTRALLEELVAVIFDGPQPTDGPMAELAASLHEAEANALFGAVRDRFQELGLTIGDGTAGVPPIRPVTAHVRDDGTGFYFDCPRCHFYKNVAPGPCRRVSCDGTVVKVEFRVTPPASEQG